MAKHRSPTVYICDTLSSREPRVPREPLIAVEPLQQSHVVSVISILIASPLITLFFWKHVAVLSRPGAFVTGTVLTRQMSSSTRLYIGGLDEKLTEDDVRDEFGEPPSLEREATAAQIFGSSGCGRHAPSVRRLQP